MRFAPRMTGRFFRPARVPPDMTRFDAADPGERRKLFADAVTAHRMRGSAFLTVEAELTEAERDAGSRDDGGSGGDDADADPVPPWIQFADQTFNLDCTDEELDRLKALVEELPEFRIDGMESPEEAEGTNVRITARSDANRLAQFVDRAFQEVYGREEDYRAWVTEI